jgi:hypothetical protein
MELAGPRGQASALAVLVAVIVIGEWLLGPPSASFWAPLDGFVAAGCFGVAALLMSARLLHAVAWWSFAFLGGAIAAGIVLPLPNPVWLVTHALVAVFGLTAGALLLVLVQGVRARR